MSHTVNPARGVNGTYPERMIQATLDQYQNEERVPAQAVHDEARQRYGDYYKTPGYNLRLYRLRAELTQADLAAQIYLRRRHISEMENNKRAIGKEMAGKLARILDCDYRKLI